MNIEDLKQYGLVNWNLATASMESDTLTLDFCTLPGMQTPPLELGQEIELGNFYGRVWSINNDFPAGSPVTLSVEVGGLISVLEKIPCVLLHGLREGIAEAGGADSPRLVRLEQVVDACNRAAAHAGLEIEYIGGTHPIMTPWSGGTDSIWSVLQNALRWAPCARTVCIGRKLTIYGLQETAETPAVASALQFTKRTRRAVSRAFDELPPPVVAARGGQSFEYPAGASIYQPGAFVYQVPDDTALPPGEPGYGTAGGREAQHEVSGQWMKIRGKVIPPGMVAAASWNKTIGTRPTGTPAKWAEFWSSFGNGSNLLADIASSVSFGTPSFDAVPGEVAYPPDEAEAGAAGGKLGPVLNETANVPANYEAFSPDGADNIYVLTEGSFPASTSPRGNVRGLRFCRGTITQWCWLNRKAQNEKELEFFSGEGTILQNGTLSTTRFACLTLSAIFINRRSKRYQTGTNKNAPGDPDYSAEDELGNATEGEQGEWKPDYRAALKAFYDATRALGEPAEEVTLFDVPGYVPGVTTLEEGFAASGIKGGMAGRMTYDAAGRTLTITNSRREVLGVDDYLQRQELGRRQRQNDEANRDYGVSAAGFPGENYTPPESEDKAAMVSPSISMTHTATKAVTRTAAPWTVFPIGDKWYLNGGTLAHGSFRKTIGITAYQYVKGVQTSAGWNANSKPWGKFYRDPDTGKMTFDIIDKQ